MSIIAALIAPVAGIIEKFVPDADTRMKLAHEISTMADTHAHAAMMAQVELNKEEAKSDKWWKAGWRPAVGWVCVAAMANNFLLLPYAGLIWEGVLPLDWQTLSPILLGMLGLGGMRTTEKVKGKN
jgi:hypothetical protein